MHAGSFILGDVNKISRGKGKNIAIEHGSCSELSILDSINTEKISNLQPEGHRC
jgi:hypothetical protein